MGHYDYDGKISRVPLKV